LYDILHHPQHSHARKGCKIMIQYILQPKVPRIAKKKYIGIEN